MEIEIKWPDQAQRKSSGKPQKQSSPKSPRKSSQEFPLKKALAVIGIAAAILLALVVLLGKATTILPVQPPEKVAAGMLTALSSGNQEDFLKHVDIGAFASFMDPTGLTRRDYAQADAARKKELELIHKELLSEDLFTSANQGRKFEIAGQSVKEVSATINVKPWIQFGNKLYKRLTFEMKGNEWKLTGLASPDI